MKHVIGEDQSRQRVDVVLTTILPDLSRAYIKKLILEERITLNGEPFKPGTHVRVGDKLDIDFDPAQLEQIEDIELQILYEDNDVLVINKPAGVISHARGRFWNESSVASFVRQKTKQSGERAGIVHRLDRVTSGVMICAKNQAALTWLQKQFADRLTEKKYVAIVEGVLKEPEAVIDMPIARNPKMPQAFKVSAQGKSAQTAYRTLQVTDKYSLLELTPRTGRTHQLRVHLKQLGHPIVGDKLYGGQMAERLFLHAQSLKLALPGGELSQFESPLPQEFTQLMETK